MTRAVEIPQGRWTAFLKMLNRLAGGRPIRLEVARRDLGDQEMGNLLPLIDVDFETKGSDRGELIIAVASERGELTHVIEKPSRMAIGLNDGNEPQWLAIDEEGTTGKGTTIVHFERLPALGQEYEDAGGAP